MLGIPVDRFLKKRINTSLWFVERSLYGASALLSVSEILSIVSELRKKGVLSWVSYTSDPDLHGFIVVSNYKILRANSDYFTFSNEYFGVEPPEDYRVELIRGYRSFYGYLVVSSRQKSVENLRVAVEHLENNDVLLRTYPLTKPVIRVS